MRTQNKYIHIRIDDDVKRNFIAECEKNCISPSKLIRKFILDFITNEKKDK